MKAARYAVHASERHDGEWNRVVGASRQTLAYSDDLVRYIVEEEGRPAPERAERSESPADKVIRFLAIDYSEKDEGLLSPNEQEILDAQDYICDLIRAKLERQEERLVESIKRKEKKEEDSRALFV